MNSTDFLVDSKFPCTRTRILFVSGCAERALAVHLDAAYLMMRAAMIKANTINHPHQGMNSKAKHRADMVFAFRSHPGELSVPRCGKG